MATIFNVLSWIFCILFLFVALLILGMGGRIQFILLLAIVLVLMPPFRILIHKLAGRALPWWIYLAIGLLLWGGVMLSFILNPAKSIYKSEAHRERLMALYDAKLADWPVPFESRMIDTEYGKIHVIVSGPKDAPPIMLINASALSAWSWIHNVEPLSRQYRTFAVDNIGEGGKNIMAARDKIPKNGTEIAALYSEIGERLGFTKSIVIGASIGGYIGTTFALHAPDRVEKLVLLGPMGYGSTFKTIVAMTLAQGFPIKPVQEATFRWAFGNAPRVVDSFEEWFRVYMKGLLPNPIMPASFTPEQLSKLQVPVLIYFGSRDGVIGNARKATHLASSIPSAQIKVVDSGHIIAAELSERVNQEILTFLQTTADK